MDSGQLTRMIRADPVCEPHFGGIYASDNLPHFVDRKPIFFVVNTDIAAGFGIHWVVFYFPSEGTPAEFFDSAGHPPERYHPDFRTFLVRNGPSYIFLTNRLQGLVSQTCGLFCLFYAQQRFHGWTLRRIMNYFKGGTGWGNDDTMRQLFTI
jgi:hypothetical protein